MANSINTSLNQLLSNYAQFSKANGAVPFQLPVNPAPPIAGPKKPDEAELRRDNNRQQDSNTTQQQLANQRQQQATLNDLSRPQVAISPADETQLFSTTAVGPNSQGDTTQEALVPQESNPSSFLVSDDVNRTRRNALAQTNDRSQLALVLQARAQAAVATLYARNNDIVYNATPIVYEAA